MHNRLGAMFTSNNDSWATPTYLLNYLDKIYNFTFDPCPLNDSPDEDGLSIKRGLSNFVNPPYSNIANWVYKAIEEHKIGNKVVLLIPARTDTRYMKAIYEYGAKFIFIIGRLSFSGKGTAPFPSVVIELVGNGKLEMEYIERDELK